MLTSPPSSTPTRTSSTPSASNFIPRRRGDKPYICGESYCPYRNTNRALFDRHERTAHSDRAAFRKLWSCSRCRYIMCTKNQSGNHRCEIIEDKAPIPDHLDLDTVARQLYDQGWQSRPQTAMHSILETTTPEPETSNVIDSLFSYKPYPALPSRHLFEAGSIDSALSAESFLELEETGPSTIFNLGGELAHVRSDGTTSRLLAPDQDPSEGYATAEDIENEEENGRQVIYRYPPPSREGCYLGWMLPPR